MKRSLVLFFLACALLVIARPSQAFASQVSTALGPVEIAFSARASQPSEAPLQLAWGRGCYRGYGGYQAYHGGYGPYRGGYGYYRGYGGYYSGYRGYYGGYGGYGYGGYGYGRW